MPEAEWVAITAIGTWALVVGTLLAEYWKIRQDRLINAANAVLDFGERFEAASQREARKRFSASVLSGVEPWLLEPIVLGFFEDLGLLARKGILDLEMIWNRFCVYVLRYYQALIVPKNYMAEFRRIDRTAFAEFEWLYRVLLGIECAKRHLPAEQARPTAEEVKSFLTAEAALAS